MLAWPREKPIRSLPTPNSSEVMAAPIHTSGQARQTPGEDPVDHGDQDVHGVCGITIRRARKSAHDLKFVLGKALALPSEVRLGRQRWSPGIERST